MNTQNTGFYFVTAMVISASLVDFALELWYY